MALPVDIVKVLKTQDENYVRTMRTAGLKVCINNGPETGISLDSCYVENRQDKGPINCHRGPHKTVII